MTDCFWFWQCHLHITLIWLPSEPDSIWNQRHQIVAPGLADRQGVDLWPVDQGVRGSTAVEVLDPFLL